MNTPEKCRKCVSLYWNVMAEDDPSYSAECRDGHVLGKCDVIVPDLRACMDKHNHKDVLCALTSCRDCKHRERV